MQLAPMMIMPLLLSSAESAALPCCPRTILQQQGHNVVKWLVMSCQHRGMGNKQGSVGGSGLRGGVVHYNLRSECFDLRGAGIDGIDAAPSQLSGTSFLNALPGTYLVFASSSVFCSFSASADHLAADLSSSGIQIVVSVAGCNQALAAKFPCVPTLASRPPPCVPLSLTPSKCLLLSLLCTISPCDPAPFIPFS